MKFNDLWLLRTAGKRALKRAKDLRKWINIERDMAEKVTVTPEKTAERLFENFSTNEQSSTFLLVDSLPLDVEAPTMH
eukprot:c13617_g1_i1 orf=73-306(+)